MKLPLILLALSNRKFLGKFAEKLGSTESAQYIDSNNQYTQSFVLRVRQAIFAKAYADERLLEMMADHSKPELQNMINDLAISAPKFIQAKAVSKSVSGQLDDVTGRIVALIPRGAMDDKLANWMAVEKTAYLAGEITLPQSTFKNAGTAVSTRIVLIEKHEFPKDAPHPKYINFTHADSPEDLFQMIRDIDVPKRKPRLDELLAVYGLYLEIDRSKYIYSGPGARKAEIKAIMIRFGDAYADGNDVVMKYNRSKTIINLIKEYERQHKISLALEP